MAKRLLTACLVVLGLSACTREAPPPSSARERSPEPRHAPPTRVLPPEEPPPPARADVGTPPEPLDPLALAHAHGGHVDHLGRAAALREEGDLSGALTEYRRALHHASGDEEVLRPLALAASRLGEHGLAAEAFGRLGRVRPVDAMPFIQQARALLALGDAPGALRAGAEALARDPENPEVHQVLGRAHLREGDLALAITRLERAVELAPEHGHALNNLGFAYLQANENERAVEMLTRAAARLPHVAYVHNNLGVALERTGRTEEARDAFALATSLSPRYVKARVNAERMRRLALAAPAEEVPEEAGTELHPFPGEPLPEEENE